MMLELELVLLVVFSLVIPAGVYAFLYGRLSISRWTVLAFAVLLIVLAGVDVGLLQSLTEKARGSPGLPGVQLFSDQLALVLYVLPAAFAGLGVNLLSHVLVNHLNEAERRFDHRHPPDARARRGQDSLMLFWAALATSTIFVLDLATGDNIRLHALYLFPLAWVARRARSWLPTGLALLGVSALQIVTFSLEAGGIASFITDALASVSASLLVVALARRVDGEAGFAPQHARDDGAALRCEPGAGNAPGSHRNAG